MADFPYFPTIGTNVCVYPQSGCATYTDSVHRLVLFGGDVLRRVLCVLVPPPIEEIGHICSDRDKDILNSCDAYYGDISSVVQEYRNADKPVMIMNYEV